MKKEVRGTVTIEVDRCKGCALCTIGCPHNLLTISEKTINAFGYHPVSIKKKESCIGCGNCFQMCPDYALTVKQVVIEGERHGQNVNERQ